MKVALILFPITNEDGLATRVPATIKAFQNEGYTANFYRISYSEKLHGMTLPRAEVTATRTGLAVQQGYLSITTQKLAETVIILNRHDLLIFVHACPHISDTQKAVENWRCLYTDTEPPKTVTFSDVYYEQLYPWITEVKHRFTALANNPAILAHIIKEFPDARLLPQVFDFGTAGPAKARTTSIVWASAWREWKGIRKFIDAAARIRGNVEIYGNGPEASNLKAEIAALPKTAKRFGFAHPDVITEAYRRSKFAADLTGQSNKYAGHYNRATIEPMLQGCVLTCRPEMVAPHSAIPAEIANVVDVEKLSDQINAAIEDNETRNKKASAAFEWARETFDPRKVVDTYLSTMK